MNLNILKPQLDQSVPSINDSSICSNVTHKTHKNPYINLSYNIVGPRRNNSMLVVSKYILSDNKLNHNDYNISTSDVKIQFLNMCNSSNNENKIDNGGYTDECIVHNFNYDQRISVGIAPREETIDHMIIGQNDKATNIVFYESSLPNLISKSSITLLKHKKIHFGHPVVIHYCILTFFQIIILLFLIILYIYFFYV